MLHTTDGGATWQPQIVGAQAPADFADAGGTAYLVAGADGPVSPLALFATTSGGAAGTPTALTIKQKTGGKGKAAKRGKIKVAGTLAPAEGGEEIQVRYRDGKAWRFRTEIAASDGSFTSAFKLRKPGPVVAQWFGDDDRAGAGSKAVVVKPPKKEPPK